MMLEYIKDPKKVICSDGIVRVITGERSRRMTVLEISLPDDTIHFRQMKGGAE